MKEKIIKISIIIFIIIIIIYNIFFKNKLFQANNIIQDFTINNTSENSIVSDIPSNLASHISDYNSNHEEENIKIYITGEIHNPGVYELACNSRIEDAIFIAGGITENANLNDVNLAYILEDAMKIYIPNKKDLSENIQVITSENSDSVITGSIESTPKNSKININKASSSELEKIPGVGPSIAQKIITYREENGKFSSIDDLKKVSGIGAKKYESIKEYITI